MLEKHADFLRDFRGDTVHASTLTLLDELGWGSGSPRCRSAGWTAGRSLGDALVTVADLSRLPGAHQHIALVRNGTCSSCWPPRR